MAVLNAPLVDLECTRCPLHRGRTQVVPPQGPATARLFLVGEAPGPDEDRQGRPFIGRAGKILRQCLDEAGIPPEHVWISNSVKCFPHEREGPKRRIRKPTTAEAEACRRFLAAELDHVEPAVVVAVGATAAAQLTGRRDIKITQEHGTVVPARQGLGRRDVLLTFHPSGLHYGHASKEDLTRDLAAAHARAYA